MVRALDAPALVPAIETGTVLLLRGWGWARDRERSPLRLVDGGASSRRAPEVRSFELVILEAGAGRPLAGVPLEVLTPDGETHRVASDGGGRVRIDDLAPGVCLVSSVIEEARVETSHSIAEPKGAGRRTAGAAPPGPAHLVRAERHRVRTGETPESIAEHQGVPWDRIAHFNWGTTDPDALESRYRDTLGSTRRTPEGRVRFDDSDDPGILLVPRPFTARLAVGAAHELFVAPLRPLFLHLENEAGLALPAARFSARFADGSERTGKLGRHGIARIDGAPEGPFTVSYPDELDLLATSLAVSVRRALGQQATAPLFTLLMQSPEVLSRASAIYQRHCDDLTGRGLVADIDQAITDPDARRPLLGLCALAGLRVEGVDSITLQNQSSPERESPDQFAATSRRRGAA
jgi:hypothetical protein